MSERPAQSVRNGPGSTISHLDSQRLDLLRQGLREPLDGELGGVVVATPGKPMKPPMEEILTICPLRCFRMPGSTAWVMAARPKKLVSNMAANLIVLALLGRRQIAVAGVVDQHVDAAEFGLGLLHRLGDLRPIRSRRA